MADTEDRSSSFAETRLIFIETASAMMRDDRREWPSVAAVAQALRINRTTAYHYCGGRRDLVSMTKRWAAEHLSGALRYPNIKSGLQQWTRFSLEHPAAVRLVLDDLVMPPPASTIESDWAIWLELVQKRFVAASNDSLSQSEVMLAWFIGGMAFGPQILRRWTMDSDAIEDVADRFCDSAATMLKG